jgi:hypothetical protein
MLSNRNGSVDANLTAIDVKRFRGKQLLVMEFVIIDQAY